MLFYLQNNRDNRERETTFSYLSVFLPRASELTSMRGRWMEDEQANAVVVKNGSQTGPIGNVYRVIFFFLQNYRDNRERRHFHICFLYFYPGRAAK